MPLKPSATPHAPTDLAAEVALRARRLALGRSAPKAGRALGELGAAALPALREALAHANPFVRSGALHGLVAAGGAGVELADLAPVAARALSGDADPRVRETAARVLRELGPAAVAGAQGELARVAAEDQDERVRAAAKEALATS